MNSRAFAGNTSRGGNDGDQLIRATMEARYASMYVRDIVTRVPEKVFCLFFSRLTSLAQWIAS